MIFLLLLLYEFVENIMRNTSFTIIFLTLCTLQLQAQFKIFKIFKKKPEDSTSYKVVANFELPTDTTVYRIKAGDRLKIRNLNSITSIFSENAGISVAGGQPQGGANATFFEAMVDKNGQIALPRVGRVKIAGLTRLEATHEIEHRYEGSITNPIFETEITNLRIKVLGGVNKQGVFVLENEKITLGEALALAGGIDFAVADKNIKLIRPREGIQEEINYNIRDLSNPKISNILIGDGDYIFVPPSKGSLRNIKNQRTSAILQPIALTLNALAVLIGLYITTRPKSP